MGSVLASCSWKLMREGHRWSLKLGMEVKLATRSIIFESRGTVSGICNGLF